MTMSPTSNLDTVFLQADLKFICLPSLAFLFPTYTLLYYLVWLYWWSPWSGLTAAFAMRSHVSSIQLLRLESAPPSGKNKHDKGASPVSWKTDL